MQQKVFWLLLFASIIYFSPERDEIFVGALILLTVLTLHETVGVNVLRWLDAGRKEVGVLYTKAKMFVFSSFRIRKEVQFFLVNVFIILLFTSFIFFVVFYKPLIVYNSSRNTHFILELYQYYIKIGAYETGEKSYADLILNILEKGYSLRMNDPSLLEHSKYIYAIWRYYFNHVRLANIIYEETGSTQHVIDYIGYFVIQENISGNLVWFSNYIDEAYEKEFGETLPFNLIHKKINKKDSLEKLGVDFRTFSKEKRPQVYWHWWNDS